MTLNEGGEFFKDFCGEKNNININCFPKLAVEAANFIAKTVTMKGEFFMPHYSAVDWRPDGSFTLIADIEGNIYRYPASNGNTCIELIHSVESPAERIDAIDWWHTCTALAAGGNWPTYNNGFIQRLYSDWSVIYSGGDDEKYWDIARRPGGNKALAVGEDHGNAIALECDLSSTIKLSPPGPDYGSVSWKPDSSYATITSDNGYLWKYNPNDRGFTEIGRFTTDYSGTDNDWRADGSHTLIVGTGGKIWKYSETAGFEEVPSPTQHRLEKVEWTPCGDMALIVGESGVVLRYDGQDVTQIRSDTHYLRDVSWKDNSEALIVGYYDTALRYEKSTGGFYSIHPC